LQGANVRVDRRRKRAAWKVVHRALCFQKKRDGVERGGQIVIKWKKKTGERPENTLHKGSVKKRLGKASWWRKTRVEKKKEGGVPAGKETRLVW